MIHFHFVTLLVLQNHCHWIKPSSATLKLKEGNNWFHKIQMQRSSSSSSLFFQNSLWFTGTLSGVTMLKTNNSQFLELSPSLTSSTRHCPLLLQQHMLKGAKSGHRRGSRSTSAGSSCSLQHPLSWLKSIGHNAVLEFGWLFGGCPWNCPHVLYNRGASFSPRP